MKSQPKSPKILFVITQGIWGGAQRYVFDLATHLHPQLPTTVAIGESEGQVDLQTALEGMPGPHPEVFQLKQLVRAIRPFSDLRAIFELRELIKAQNPTLLHLNSSKAGIIGSLAVLGLKNRPKVIYTVHGWVFLEPLSPWVRWLYKFLEKHTASSKDHIIVLSEKEKKVALGLGIPESKLTIIPLGIDQPKFFSRSEARAQIRTLADLAKSQDQWIGTIANLFLTKGIDLLIAAAKNLITTRPNLHFFIIGSGPEKSKLEKLISQTNLKNHIHLLGSQTKAAELLPAFDLFVLPSRKEGLPYTILEAMSANLPIVATAVGGVSSLLTDYEQSFLVPPNNSQALTETIHNALQYLETKKPENKTATVNSVAAMMENTRKIYT